MKRIALFLPIALIFSISSYAEEKIIVPEIPVTVRSVSYLDACSSGEIVNLDPQGDNFLSVRSKPTAQSKDLDRLHNGDVVYYCDRRGSWVGIVYSQETSECGVMFSEDNRKISYKGPCKSGWVYKDYVIITAG